MKCPRFVAFCAWLIALVLMSFGCDGGGTGTGGTGGTTCDVAACPLPSGECVEAVCSPKGACTEASKADGSPAMTQIPGDCNKNVCQAGAVVKQNDDTEVPDDGNQCTLDECSGGVSSHPPAPVDSPCGQDALSYCDGNGACVECNDAVQCAAPANSCLIPTCVAMACGTEIKADGASCDDGDACTQTDACQSGACIGGNAVTCAAPDQCHGAATCNAATGLCDNPAKADGTSCDDGDACTQTDACQSGACTGNPMTCVLGAVCVAGACVYDPIAYIKASDTNTWDTFGGSVALSADGNTLAVGAWRESSSATGVDGNQADYGAPNAGAVYVFTRSGAVWSQQAYIKASNTGSKDDFGWRVALSGDGNTLAVGADYEDSSATGIDGDQTDNFAKDAGAVYVFTRSGAVWSQQAYIKASNTTADDEFGYSLALSGDGNTLAVGAHLEDSNATGIDGNQADNSFPDAGAVYVFTRSGALWSQQAYIKASNTTAYDEFGYSVALSANGNTLAIGAPEEDSNATGIDGNQADNMANDAGAVYVFTRIGAVWSQQAYVKASNTGSADNFGHSVALSADGNTLAVGAHWEASNATGVGGDQANDSLSWAGAVYVFMRSGALWSQQAYIKASNTGSEDEFGHDVALSADGNTLAVGARYESSNATGIGGDEANDLARYSGAVYAFTRSGAVWSQQTYVKATNTAADDYFGEDMALSADGNTLAVGAGWEDSNATGIDGDQANNLAPNAGAVYVY